MSGGAGTRSLAAPAPDLDRLPELVRSIRRVPTQVRRFTVSPRTARARHRIGEELADLLVAEGLPCVGSGADRLFDDYDLGNIALHLGLLSVRRMTMRAWAAGLRRNSAAGASRLRVQVVTRCPVPGHDGPCSFGLLRPGGGREVVRVARESAPIASYEVRLPGEWPELDGAARCLVDELADVDFFLLPEAIRWDADFLLRTRMADCGGFARRLVDEGRRRGIPVRFAFGLLVVKPYSTPHCWAEFRIGDTWVPQDPLLLKAMRSWAGLDAAEWPAHRSPGAVLHRLCGRFTKLVSHRGVWTSTSLPTDYLDEVP
ncbi:transglutaminase domain-containing protein [Saccharopolyspora rosea]|uniref:Transglutaminase domain-containing protein n=1 Tax=Saccharopolyspora rosea TaxID=524884 RepID=A0ABW3FZN5_9PSEU|nr:transglutaminase domain-containing protein [Saccharopolyspora rosea]